jgi:hypothetical protein
MVLAAAGIVGLGFYQGWLLLVTGEADGKPGIVVTVDLEKVVQDLEKAEEKLQEVGQQLNGKARGTGGGSKEGTPRP